MASSQTRRGILNNDPREAKTREQWKIEREILSQQIDSLELKVKQLTNEPSSIEPPVGDILMNFYTLGLKIFEAEPQEIILQTHNQHFTPTETITHALLNISSKLQYLDSSDDGLVIIDPKPNPGPTSTAVDVLVKTVFDLYKPKGDLKYLEGNFGPVSLETPPTSDIVIEQGKIPVSLSGMMLRNGPNPKFNPEGHYMWLDGDSMIHGIRFKDGKSTYVARYTQTSRLIQEGILKKSMAIKFGDLIGGYGVFTTFVEILRARLKIMDTSFGISTANTGLVYHLGRIMALEDFGEPHVIYVTQDGDLKTLGINNYNGELDHWLSPHPKKDPTTGEMFNFGSMRKPPYCIYRVISKDGVISNPVEIPVEGPTYMHDLCITKNYVIFQELPLIYDPENMKTSNDEKEWIFHYAKNKKPRYGILKRHATSGEDITWFEFEDPFFVFHNANAWEEDDDTIVLYCCNMEPKTNPHTNDPYIFPAAFQRYVGSMDFEPTWPQLYKMSFNMNTKKGKKEKISYINGDFPKINESYMGRKTQYVYISEVNDENKIISVVKYDLEQEGGNPKRLSFGDYTYGGEVVFTPKTDDNSTKEDDGYLLVFVHHETIKDSTKGTSYVYVIDAKSMEYVAKLRLPERVPYGFHAIYVTEKELQNQIKPSSKTGLKSA